MNLMYIQSIVLVTAFSFTLSGSEASPSLEAENLPLGGQEQCSNEHIDRVVRGDLFIIPNAAFTASEMANNYRDQETIPRLNRQLRPYGCEIQPSGEVHMLEVWATTKENDSNGSDNWESHGHPHLYKFPRYLPLDLLTDEKGELKKDGDELILYHENPESRERIKVILTLNQRGYRYFQCGNDGGFDKCVQQAIAGGTELNHLFSAQTESIVSDNAA